MVNWQWDVAAPGMNGPSGASRMRMLLESLLVMCSLPIVLANLAFHSPVAAIAALLMVTVGVGLRLARSAHDPDRMRTGVRLAAVGAYLLVVGLAVMGLVGAVGIVAALPGIVLINRATTANARAIAE